MNSLNIISQVSNDLFHFLVEYTKGGGMTKGTSNRKFILHQEGGTQPEKRSPPNTICKSTKRLKTTQRSYIIDFDEFMNNHSSLLSSFFSPSSSFIPWDTECEDCDDVNDDVWLQVLVEKVFS